MHSTGHKYYASESDYIFRIHTLFFTLGIQLNIDLNDGTSSEVEASNNSHKRQDNSYAILDHFLFAIDLIYMPLIIIPSIYVISAVTLMTKLHSPHNTIILAIGVSDLLVAIVCIPKYVLLDIRVTREMIFSTKHLCFFLNIIVDAVEVTGISILTLLGLDSFIQIRFPLEYRAHITITKTIVCIITIASINVFIVIIFFGLLAMSNYDCRTPNVGKEAKTVWKVYLLYLTITVVLLLSLCIIFGIYVRYKRWMLGKGTTTGKITTWLLMAFIIFYLPTVFGLLVAFDGHQRDMFRIVRLIRYLAPVTNWYLIYLSRPDFKFAFKYFLKAKPNHWDRVENSFRRDVHYCTTVTSLSCPMSQTLLEAESAKRDNFTASSCGASTKTIKRPSLASSSRSWNSSTHSWSRHTGSTKSNVTRMTYQSSDKAEDQDIRKPALLIRPTTRMIRQALWAKCMVDRPSLGEEDTKPPLEEDDKSTLKVPTPDYIFFW